MTSRLELSPSLRAKGGACTFSRKDRLAAEAVGSSPGEISLLPGGGDLIPFPLALAAFVSSANSYLSPWPSPDTLKQPFPLDWTSRIP